MGAAGLLALSSCVGPDCTLAMEDGLIVSVRDSVTLIPAGNGATVLVQDGNHLETLRYNGFLNPLDSLSFQGATERPGTYEVRITKPGYRLWTRTGVRVNRGDCHVIPVRLEALLQPSLESGWKETHSSVTQGHVQHYQNRNPISIGTNHKVSPLASGTTMPLTPTATPQRDRRQMRASSPI